MKIFREWKWSQVDRASRLLFLGKRDLNRVSGRQVEALQCVARYRRLRLVLELDECNVGPPGNQTDLRAEPYIIILMFVCTFGDQHIRIFRHKRAQRTSLKPGNWRKSIVSIDASTVASFGRPVMNRILLGGSFPVATPTAPLAAAVVWEAFFDSLYSTEFLRHNSYG